MTLEILGLLLAGILLLGVGADVLVRGAARLARGLRISPLMVGLTVVAIGTSTPELVVGITASLEGNTGIVVANIAGTNIFNTLFILGASALVMPAAIELQTVRLDLPVMVLAAFTLTVLAWDGLLSRGDALLLLGIAVAYTALLVDYGRRESAKVEQEFAGEFGARPGPHGGVWRNLLFVVAGIGCTIAGAEWMVRGAVEAARLNGVSEAIVGLTIVGVGTSAPEIVIIIVATLRRERDVAVGNLLGSGVYNICVILAVTCLVSEGGVAVPLEAVRIDLLLQVGVALACVPVFISGRRISRAEGAGFVLAYVAYLSTILLVRI